MVMVQLLSILLLPPPSSSCCSCRSTSTSSLYSLIFASLVYSIYFLFCNQHRPMETLESGNIKFPISPNPMHGEFLCHCVSLGTRKSAIAGQPPPIWQHHNSIEACLGQLSIYVAKKQFSRWIQKWVDWPEMVWLLQKSVQTMHCPDLELECWSPNWGAGQKSSPQAQSSQTL